jgi:hypothetical protein
VSGREYQAFASLPDLARTPVSVAVYHDPVRRMWGAYVLPMTSHLDGKCGPVAWGLTGDAATRRAVADYYMASIQITLPLTLTWVGEE